MTLARPADSATIANGDLGISTEAVRVSSTCYDDSSIRRVRLRSSKRLKRIGGIVFVLVALAVGLLVGHWRLEERWSTHRWGVVVPERVFRSGQISRYQVEDVLTRNKIATIINLCGHERHNADQLVEVAVAEYLEIDYHRFPLNGSGTGDVKKYVDAVELLARREREGKPVLIHCAAGTYRTGGVIAVYRLLVRGDSPASVADEMVAFGYSPADSPKLISYINSNMEYFAKELAARNVLDRIPDHLPQLSP